MLQLAPYTRCIKIPLQYQRNLREVIKFSRQEREPSNGNCPSGAGKIILSNVKNSIRFSY